LSPLSKGYIAATESKQQLQTERRKEASKKTRKEIRVTAAAAGINHVWENHPRDDVQDPTAREPA
jgi:hypothetical protein